MQRLQGLGIGWDADGMAWFCKGRVEQVGHTSWSQRPESPDLNLAQTKSVE
jgi:hypothetical protein